MTDDMKTAESAEDILGLDDLPRETVLVPEWGLKIIVRAMTGQERDDYEMALFNAREDGGSLNLRARLVAMTAINSSGDRLFKTEALVVRLGQKSGRALDRVFEAAQRLSATGGKALKSAVGNSSGATGDAPSSASGSPSESSPATSSPA